MKIALLLLWLLVSSYAFGLSCAFPNHELVLLCEKGQCRGFNAGFKTTGFPCQTVPVIQPISVGELSVVSKVFEAKSQKDPTGVFALKLPAGCLRDRTFKPQQEACDLMTTIRELSSVPSSDVLEAEEKRWKGVALLARVTFWIPIGLIFFVEMSLFMATFFGIRRVRRPLLKRVLFLVAAVAQVGLILFNRGAFLGYWTSPGWSFFGLVLCLVMLVGAAGALKNLFSRRLA